MARLESDHGRLLISFQFDGKRCHEYIGLADNRRAAQRLLREIELDSPPANSTMRLDSHGAKP